MTRRSIVSVVAKTLLAVGLSAQPPKIPAYRFSDVFTVGKWTYVGHSARWMPFVGSSIAPIRPAAAFMVLDLEIRNDDNIAHNLPPIFLYDSEGRRYEQTLVPGNQYLDPFTRLNPSLAKRGYIVFDVVPSRRYSMAVFGMDGEAAIVILPYDPSEKPQ